MKSLIILAVSLALQTLAWGNSPLSAEHAAGLLKKMQTCTADKCWQESFSSETSLLERRRAQDWILRFKVGDVKLWRECNLKLRPETKNEICFAQPESNDLEVRIIFNHENSTWRLMHISLPSSQLGW